MFIISLIFQAFDKMAQPAAADVKIILQFVFTLLSNLFASHMNFEFNEFTYKDKIFPDGIFMKMFYHTQTSIDALSEKMRERKRENEDTNKFFRRMETFINDNVNGCLAKIVFAVFEALGRKGGDQKKHAVVIYGEICSVTGEIMHPDYKLCVDAMLKDVVFAAIDDFIKRIKLELTEAHKHIVAEAHKHIVAM